MHEQVTTNKIWKFDTITVLPSTVSTNYHYLQSQHYKMEARAEQGKSLLPIFLWQSETIMNLLKAMVRYYGEKERMDSYGGEGCIEDFRRNRKAVLWERLCVGPIRACLIFGRASS